MLCVDGSKHLLSPILVSFFNIDKYELGFLKKSVSLICRDSVLQSENIGELLFKWMEIKLKFEPFGEMIRDNFLKWSPTLLQEDIVISLTLIEAISYSEEHDDKKKYITAFKKYASKDLLNYISGCFSLSSSDAEILGRSLSDLRNMIAHVNKNDSKYFSMHDLFLHDLAGIALGIKITIASYIYSQLGLSKDWIKSFQERTLRALCKQIPMRHS